LVTLKANLSSHCDGGFKVGKYTGTVPNAGTVKSPIRGVEKNRQETIHGKAATIGKTP
tara:strand:- start:1096 stop:1269 length:174 start_codon:yes stop_codon:yes gene_type:complete